MLHFYDDLAKNSDAVYAIENYLAWTTHSDSDKVQLACVGSIYFYYLRQVAVAVGSDRAKHDFNLILRKMFADGVINWGRIVVMFALAIDVQHSRAIDLQLETALFVEANLSEWLVDQGGWDAVVPVCDALLPTASLASSTPSIAVVIAVTAFVATLVTAVLLQTI
jgi:hypothetical protein